jgi:hypothetical protein
MQLLSASMGAHATSDPRHHCLLFGSRIRQSPASLSPACAWRNDVEDQQGVNVRGLFTPDDIRVE